MILSIHGAAFLFGVLLQLPTPPPSTAPGANEPAPAGTVRLPNGRLRLMTEYEREAEVNKRASVMAKEQKDSRTPEQMAELAERREREASDTARIHEAHEAEAEARRALRRPFVEAQRQAALSEFNDLFALGIAQSNANAQAAMGQAYRNLGLGGAAAEAQANLMQAQAVFTQRLAQAQRNSITREQFLAAQLDIHRKYLADLNTFFQSFQDDLRQMKLVTSRPAAGPSALGAGSPDPAATTSTKELITELKADLKKLRRVLATREAMLRIIEERAQPEFRQKLFQEISLSWGPCIATCAAIQGRPFIPPAGDADARPEAQEKARRQYVLDTVGEIEKLIESVESSKHKPSSAAMPGTGSGAAVESQFGPASKK